MSEPKYLTIASLSRALLADRRSVEKLDLKADAELVQPSGKSLPLYNAARTALIAQELLAQASKRKRK
jgi:hypothetical protein